MSLKTSPHQSQNLPWVKVHNLASQVLGLAARHVPKDCEQRYRFRPVLLETFVDPSRYRGTSYQAAGWQKVGQTLGRKKGSNAKRGVPQAAGSKRPSGLAQPARSLGPATATASLATAARQASAAPTALASHPQGRQAGGNSR
ncbi:MAG: DUF4338 domain-containing protein [Aestuariivita sp.]|nr:DUF4338 domain-containing protein [Aestuariivita sp.]MCY4201241.1 DUF4338 domain-containing protein [Aestuariivita sp.]